MYSKKMTTKKKNSRFCVFILQTSVLFSHPNRKKLDLSVRSMMIYIRDVWQNILSLIVTIDYDD